MGLEGWYWSNLNGKPRRHILFEGGMVCDSVGSWNAELRALEVGCETLAVLFKSEGSNDALAGLTDLTDSWYWG